MNRGRLLGRYSGGDTQLQNMGLYRPYHGGFLTQVDTITFSGASRYSNFYPYTKGISVIATRYANLGAPELVAKKSNLELQISLSQKDEDISIPTPKVTLQERVKNNLSSRCQVYEFRAMEAFKAGGYQEACNQLTLAETTVVDDPDRQMYFKLVFMYASIAAQQYSEALNALIWMLGKDPTTGGLRNPQVLNQVRDVGLFYGRRDDYADHLRRFTSFIEQQPKAPGVLAMRAMVAWGRGDVANATFYARQLADESPPEARWPRLYEMIQQAQQGSRAEKTEQAREPVPARSSRTVVGEGMPKAGEGTPE